ncbi:MAG: hypothetical protein HZA58_07005 [Acidimicrobiia bacterium]|nr:hypothetical protein [Acidimicrobiia bacterium]
MDHTPVDRLPPASGHTPGPNPAVDEGFGDALEALAAADPAEAPDLADAIAERLGAVLAEEDEDAHTAQA